MENSFYSDFIDNLTLKMIEFDKGDAKRIQHFLKVHRFAALIAAKENTNLHTRFIIECAAVLHDIGIHPAEEKYGSCSGKFQEKEGPFYAKKLLEELNADKNDTDRICFLIGHHHTYKGIDGIDWQILVEADFLVNIYEDELDKETAKQTCKIIFKTETGKSLCRKIYYPEENA